MSNVVKILKQLASSEEYKVLEAAIKDSNAENIISSYKKLSETLEKSEAEVVAKMQELPRLNKDKDIQNFRATFASRSRTVLPQWYWLNDQLKQQKIMEGKVFSFGSKGDPLVRTPEGKLVIITGATLKEGDVVRFKVINSTEKADFGVLFELTPDNLYAVLTQESRDKVMNSMASLRDHIDNFSQNGDADKLIELSQLLKEFDDVKELAAKLRGEEKERIIARAVAYRKKLLNTSIVKLVYDFLAKREEDEIRDFYGDDTEKLSLALMAPALLRYDDYLSLKAELLAGDKPKGYAEAADKLEKKLDSMEAALQLLDFKSKVQGSYSLAKTYLDQMDRLFGKITRRANEVALQLETDASDESKIKSIIEKAFSKEAIRADVVEVFRGSEEFFKMRAALIELMASLGNPKSSAESLLEPYLRKIVG
ncbi:MAG: hypothetical protein V1767_02370 [Chloroflexota bacterium]